MLPKGRGALLIAAWPLAALILAFPRPGGHLAANLALLSLVAAWVLSNLSERSIWSRPRWLWMPRLAGPAYLAAMAGLGMLAYANFSNFDWGDISYYLSSFRNADGWLPGANVFSGRPFLAHHSEFWCLPVAWLFRLHPGPLMPWLAQSGAALAAWYLFRRWLIRRTGDAAMGEWLAFAFALSPCLTAPLLRGFHGVALAPPFLVLAATAFYDREWKRFLIALALLLLVKEVFAVTALSFGVCAAVQRRPWRWIAVPIVVGLAWGAFLRFLFFPWMLGDSGYYYASLFTTTSAGGSIPHALASPDAWRYLLCLALWGGTALALRSPYALAALPPAGLNLLLDGFASPWAHYIIEPAFWIFFAGAVSFIDSASEQSPRFDPRLRWVAFVATFLFMGFLSRQGLPLYRHHPLEASYRGLLERLPPDASVAIGVPLEDRLWKMKSVYFLKPAKAPWLPYTSSQACRLGEYAALQKTFPRTGGPDAFLPDERERIRACAESLRADPDWTVAWEDADVELLRRRPAGLR